MRSALLEMLILLEETTRNALIEMHNNGTIDQFPRNDCDAATIAFICAAGFLHIQDHVTDSIFYDQEQKCKSRFNNYSLWKNNNKINLATDLTNLGIKFRRYMPELHKYVCRFQAFVHSNKTTLPKLGSTIHYFENEKSMANDLGKIARDDWDILLVEAPIGTLKVFGNISNEWIPTNLENQIVAWKELRFDETSMQLFGYDE